MPTRPRAESQSDDKAYAIVEVAGQGRGLVAARDLCRGDVVLRDRAVAVGLDEVELLRNCAADPAARAVIDELCSLSYDALDGAARRRLADAVDGAADLAAFFAPHDDADEFDEAWAKRASLRLECNVFTLWTVDYERRSMGLFPVARLLNHACAPNCVREQDGDDLRFTALADIPAGGALTFSYVPAAYGRAARRRLLRDYFQFACGCPRCAGDPAADERARGALAHVGCGGSWNAAGRCAICGAPKPTGR